MDRDIDEALGQQHKDWEAEQEMLASIDNEPQPDRVELLSSALKNVLRRAGVLNSDTEPNGAELIMAAGDYCESKPQPDQSSRLLTDEKIRKYIIRAGEKLRGTAGSPTAYNKEEFVTFSKRILNELLEAQRDLTASIKDAGIGELIEQVYAECQQEINDMVKIQTARIEAFISSMRRFWAKVEVCPNGCWEWRGATNGKGYGQFWNGGKAMPAHRFLYELFIKKIEDDLELDHLCRNQKCVNPSHLEAVTHRENLRRGIGRQHWLNKTHCKHGHPFNEENTYTKPGTTWRDCRPCHKRWSREIRLRKRLDEALKATHSKEE